MTTKPPVPAANPTPKPSSAASAGAPATTDPAMQGEGNIDADRRYRQSVEQFVDAGRVDAAAKAAAPDDAKTAEAMAQAEREGKAHAKC